VSVPVKERLSALGRSWHYGRSRPSGGDVSILCEADSADQPNRFTLTPPRRPSTIHRIDFFASLPSLSGVAQNCALGVTSQECVIDRPKWTQDGDLRFTGGVGLQNQPDKLS
jgi:hypothetical protein